MDGNGWKQLEVAGNGLNGQICLYLAVYGWKWLELAGNGWSWLEMAGMDGNGQK